MSLSAILGNALAGLEARQTRLSASANNIANTQTPDYRRVRTVMETQPDGGVSAIVTPIGDPGRPDTLRDVTDLVEASQGVAANMTALETGADLWDILLLIRRD